MYKGILINLFLLVVDLWLSMGNDYYDILGISRTADRDEIRRAFKKLAVLEHPDKNNDNPAAQEKFIRLTKAYETLKDPILRKQYDIYGEKGLDNNNQKHPHHSWNHYANNIGIYNDDLWVVTLDENDYFECVTRRQSVWFINFYSPMCSHCHRLAPIWRHIAEELDVAVRIGAVNCEDEWRLCRQIGIRSYPTLMYYSKSSEYGERYNGEKSYVATMNFILNKLEVDIREIEEPLENVISRGNEGTNKSMLIFVCGGQRKCFTSTERFQIAAIFENTIDVGIFVCDNEEKCENVISRNTNSIYLSMSLHTNNSWHVMSFENVTEPKTLVEKIMDRLPEPCDLDANEFKNIRQRLTTEETSDPGWLICFHIGRALETDSVLKRLFVALNTIKLGKLNCGKYSEVCVALGVNRYPMWGVLKPGGAFELYHGKDAFNEIIKFVYGSIKAINVWTLTLEQITSILEGRSSNDRVWFVEWYMPWCPPCIRFFKEIRKASTEFDKSIVRFGTIDCTVHTTICHRHNIRSYPAAMLVNNTNVHQFSMQKTAANIVQFINEARNPTVVRLTLRNFQDHLDRRKDKLIWVIDYFAPWCAPCQHLAPEWIVVANSLSMLSFVKVASVDCEAESKLCSAQGIRSYPTIRMRYQRIQDQATINSYNGQRDSTSILQWISNFFPRKVRELDPSSLKRETLSDRNVWVVDFFVPWCEHCRKLEPQFAIVAQVMQKTIRFGRFNCETYSAECVLAGIKSYPSLMVYDPRYKKKKLTNGFRINGTTADSIKRNLLDFVAPVGHDEL